MSNLIRLKVGFADNRAHPDRTSSASQGARMLLLLPQAFLCVLVLYQYVNVQFLWTGGSRTRTTQGKALRVAVPFCSFPRLWTPWDNSYICSDQTQILELWLIHLNYLSLQRSWAIPHAPSAVSVTKCGSKSGVSQPGLNRFGFQHSRTAPAWASKNL